MRPPICAVCGKSFDSGQGGLLSFRLTAEETLFNKRFEEEGFVGHPKGLEWFCAHHYPKAKQLTHLSLGEAMRQLKAME